MTVNNTIITQSIMISLEKQAKLNKLKPLELFLVNLNQQNVQFESPPIYHRFLQLMSHANQELYYKGLSIFRSTLGLPVEAFQDDITLVAADKETVFKCSALLLKKLFPFFNGMLNNHLKEG